MVEIEIEAEVREEIGKKSKKIRENGLIPAVVYGKKLQSRPVSVDMKEFIKKVINSDAGLNLIFNLKLNEKGKTRLIPVKTYDLQKDPLTDKIIHLDLMHILMDEIIKAKVPVEIVGSPIGVKDGGVLVHGLREIEIKCLPRDIPDKFSIEVSELKIGDSLQVSDLQIKGKIELITSLNETIVHVSAPTKEEVVAPPAAPTPEEAAAEAVQTEVAEEKVKEKAPPGAAPPKEAKETKAEK